jgi:hypothetical protein
MATYKEEIKNMRLISHHDLNGFGNAGEGVALQQLGDGRRIFWIAHESAPHLQRAPIQSMTFTWTKTESSTPLTGSRAGCTSWN